LGFERRIGFTGILQHESGADRHRDDQQRGEWKNGCRRGHYGDRDSHRGSNGVERGVYQRPVGSGCLVLLLVRIFGRVAAGVHGELVKRGSGTFGGGQPGSDSVFNPAAQQNAVIVRQAKQNR